MKRKSERAGHENMRWQNEEAIGNVNYFREDKWLKLSFRFNSNDIIEGLVVK